MLNHDKLDDLENAKINFLKCIESDKNNIYGLFNLEKDVLWFI